MEIDEKVMAKVHDLVSERLFLKENLKAAQSALDANTMAIASVLPCDLGSSKTTKLSDGVSVKVVRGLRYKVTDEERIRELCPEFPPLKIKTEVTLDQKGYRWYADNDPSLFRKVADCVTVTESKVSVDVSGKKKG